MNSFLPLPVVTVIKPFIESWNLILNIQSLEILAQPLNPLLKMTRFDKLRSLSNLSLPMMRSF